jgi:hypothetical protein
MNASAILAPTRNRDGPSIEQTFDDVGYEIRRNVCCVPRQEDGTMAVEVEWSFVEIFGAREIE